MLTRKFTLKPIVIAGAAVFTLLAAPLVVDTVFDDLGWTPVAMAEEDGGGGGGTGAVNKGGHHGARPEGKGGSRLEPGTQPWPEGKGPPEDSDYWNNDGKGPRMGGDPDKMKKPEGGTSGGAPAWAAQELEDIGRLNVGRAPGAVLTKAEQNAIAELSADYLDFYGEAVKILVDLQEGDLTAEQAELALAELLRTAGDLRIDSPLANLAFYQDILDGDMTVTKEDGTVVFQATTPEELNAYAAIFLGAAADKTKPVVAETVHAVDVILTLEEPTPIGQDPVNNDLAQDTEVAEVAAVMQDAIVQVHDE